jgi:hypothetical protein
LYCVIVKDVRVLKFVFSICDSLLFFSTFCEAFEDVEVEMQVEESRLVQSGYGG